MVHKAGDPGGRIACLSPVGPTREVRSRVSGSRELEVEKREVEKSGSGSRGVRSREARSREVWFREPGKQARDK